MKTTNEEEWWLPRFKPGDLCRMTELDGRPILKHWSRTARLWVAPVPNNIFICTAADGGIAELLGMCWHNGDHQPHTIHVINIGDKSKVWFEKVQT